LPVSTKHGERCRHWNAGAGVEITTRFDGRQLHLLGLFARSDVLNRFLTLQAAIRLVSPGTISMGVVERLRGLGVSVLVSEADACAVVAGTAKSWRDLLLRRGTPETIRRSRSNAGLSRTVAVPLYPSKVYQSRRRFVW
jgi:hypothetical protein